MPAGLSSVAWCTNLAAPYRLPVWDALAQKVDLHVRTLAVTEPGRHWDWPTPDGYTLEQLPSIGMPIRDGVLYTLWRRPKAELLPRVSAVILPGWENPAAWQLRAWARRHEIATVAFYESTTASHRANRGPVASVRSHFLRTAGSVLTAGTLSRDAVLEMGVPSDRVITGFNPVDGAWFAAAAQQHRDQGARPSSGHRYLYVGQLIARKNVGGLLDAFAAINNPDDTLTIAGDGQLRGELEAKTAGMTFAGKVRFVGHVEQSNLPALYADADTLVLPSTVEVWGLVVNEALACGLHAVVSNRCGALASVDGMPGVFTSEPTVSALAAALRRSRDAWRGPIKNPPIHGHTPAAFADCALEAVERSISISTG